MARSGWVVALVALASAALVPAPSGRASQLVDRNATHVRLEVDRDGRALLTYRVGGAVRHVLAWGAVNAVAPSARTPQVAFALDYSGAHGAFVDACRPAHLRLAWLVVACRAPDGSFWAVQRWQRGLLDYGQASSRSRRAWELRLSHWSGPLPKLVVGFGWTYRRYVQLFGRLTYRGQPVYGFRATGAGSPRDRYGRNVYVDTFDSAYGRGWRRENSFLTHRPGGGFCYGFYPHGDRPSGLGTRIRATVIGPGVTPDVAWEGPAPAAYERGADLAADRRLMRLLPTDPLCRPR